MYDNLKWGKRAWYITQKSNNWLQKKVGINNSDAQTIHGLIDNSAYAILADISDISREFLTRNFPTTLRAANPDSI